MPEDTKETILTTRHTGGQTSIRLALACGFIASLASTVLQDTSLGSLLWCAVLWLILATVWYLVTISPPVTPAVTERVPQHPDTSHTLRVSEEGAFLSSMGHDLRQPTQAISLFAATLSTQPLPDASRKLVCGIEDAIHQLSEQLEAIFAIAKVQAGRMQSNPQRIALENIFEAQVSMHLDDAHDKNLHLRHVRTGSHTIADEDIVSRIVARMLEHALQTTEEGGIVLGCRYRKDYCQIEVRASSKGATAEKLDQAFTPGSTYGQSFPDRGLGLVLAHRLTALLGGRLEINSPRSHGLVLSLELPRA